MTNYGTLIDNTFRPAPRAFMLHGAMVTNTFTRWGFYVDRLTRWRVRMEVEK